MGRNKFILGGIMKSLLSTLLILALTGCAVGGSLKPEVTKRQPELELVVAKRDRVEVCSKDGNRVEA